MKLKALPTEWERILGICIIDPDGWKRNDFGKDWNTPITFDDFMDKCDESTTLHYNLTREEYREIVKNSI